MAFHLLLRSWGDLYMSTKGIYSALSGAMAQSQKLETIANNIANVNTPSFKRDQQVFQEYLASYEKLPDVIEAPRIPASIESFYDMQGGDRSYVDNAGTSTDFSQGSLKQTGNVLDVAIEGEGLLEVATPNGIRLTRNGSFKINSQGTLVTKEGYPVLREGTEAPDQRTFQLQGADITISAAGNIFNGDRSLGKLSLVHAQNRDALHKQGTSYYTLRPNMDPQLTAAQNYKVHQGYLETSNVNVVREMTDMIATTRLFESTQKAIQAFDQMNQKLVNDVPKF